MPPLEGVVTRQCCAWDSAGDALCVASRLGLLSRLCWVIWGWGVAWGPLCAAGPGITAAWKAGDSIARIRNSRRSSRHAHCIVAVAIRLASSTSVVAAAAVHVDRVAGVPIEEQPFMVGEAGRG